MMARVDPAFAQEVRAHFAAVSLKRDADWVALFRDSKLGRKELKALRFFLTDVLRGAAARRASDLSASAGKDEFDLVKNFLTRAMIDGI
jgi:hypothetical protein